MTCYYEGYDDPVMGKDCEVVGARCVECQEAKEKHGAYTNCPRFKRIQNGGWR